MFLGDKMSKSKGNVVDPLHIINGTTLDILVNELKNGNQSGYIKDKDLDKYTKLKSKEFPNGIEPCGADALRFALLDYLTQSNSINLDVQRIIGYKHFGNKIWNSVKFALKFAHINNKQCFSIMTIDELNKNYDKLSNINKWILSRLNKTIKIVDDNNSKYMFGISTNAIHDFYLHYFCDIYLELIKPLFPYNSDPKTFNTLEHKLTQNVLYYILNYTFKLLHPFMPFITEELYQRLPKLNPQKEEYLIVQLYPEINTKWDNDNVGKNMNIFMDIVNNIRSIKQNELGLNTKTKYNVKVSITNNNDNKYTFLKEYINEMITLTMLNKIDVLYGNDDIKTGDYYQSSINNDILVYSDVNNIDPSLNNNKTITVNWKKQINKFKPKLSGINKNIKNIEQQIRNNENENNAKKLQTQLKDAKNELNKTTKLIERLESMQ